MKSITEVVSSFLISNSVIKESDKEIFEYGMDLFVSSALELLSIMIISLFVRNFKETVLFFAFFIPLRIYAGGYHADTKLKCYIVSLAVYGVFTLMLKYLSVQLYHPVILAEVVFSVIVVTALAPVVHSNKSANSSERKIYKKISVIIAIIQVLVILILLWLVNNKIYALCLSLGQFAETMSIVISAIKAKLYGK